MISQVLQADVDLEGLPVVGVDVAPRRPRPSPSDRRGRGRPEAARRRAADPSRRSPEPGCAFSASSSSSSSSVSCAQLADRTPHDVRRLADPHTSRNELGGVEDAADPPSPRLRRAPPEFTFGAARRRLTSRSTDSASLMWISFKSSLSCRLQSLYMLLPYTTRETPPAPEPNAVTRSGRDDGAGRDEDQARAERLIRRVAEAAQDSGDAEDRHRASASALAEASVSRTRRRLHLVGGRSSRRSRQRGDRSHSGPTREGSTGPSACAALATRTWLDPPARVHRTRRFCHGCREAFRA